MSHCLPPRQDCLRCRAEVRAAQMTEREWRRILWLADLKHLGSLGVATFFIPVGAMLAAYACNLVPNWTIFVLPITWIAASVILFIAGDRTNDLVPAAREARRCHNNRIRNFEERRKEAEQVVLDELVQDCGIGLGDALWADCDAIEAMLKETT